MAHKVYNNFIDLNGSGGCKNNASTYFVKSGVERFIDFTARQVDAEIGGHFLNVVGSTDSIVL
jgi:hypothetical protein